MKIDYIRLKNNCFMLSFLNDTKIILFFISLFYIFVYFSLNSTPGNSPFTHPIGWWGWFDQGEYIKSICWGDWKFAKKQTLLRFLISQLDSNFNQPVLLAADGFSSARFHQDIPDINTKALTCASCMEQEA